MNLNIPMHYYPFSAIVGQEKLKQALLLCAVNPGIGGVLIKGEKGTAKTTAARGLSAVMPLVKREFSLLFDSAETEQSVDSQWVKTDFEQIAPPFVDLPLGASEDRLIGSLDLEAILSEKKRKLQPGLLAAAHRGILYIDEVNLLADHLVDILLDVAASGMNTIEREGLSASHPSRFVLIGTMNPEEGNLRPQFLDRFGLMVEVAPPQDIAERTEVVRRRMEFEANPAAFVEKWRLSQLALQERIHRAQLLLPSVQMPDGLLSLISQICMEWSVASLRADIVMYKTAVTLAAWAGRSAVISDDIKQAAQLVLIHRVPGINPGARDFGAAPGLAASPELGPSPSAGLAASPELGPSPSAGLAASPELGPSPSAGLAASPELGPTPAAGLAALPERAAGGELSGLPERGPGGEEKVLGVAALGNVELKSEAAVVAPELSGGRRSKAWDTVRGMQVRVEKDVFAKDLAVTASLMHAVARDPDQVGLAREDLHRKVKQGKAGNLILFVVDASGSMSAGKRMEAVKGSVLSLLEDAYQKRDTVGVISFRGLKAEVLLEPTASTERAIMAMQSLPTGGRTPLAHALQLAQELLTSYQSRSGIKPFLVILSDGKANVPLPGGGDPWSQTVQIAAQISGLNIQSLVLDTEKGYLRFGRAAELAQALGAECLSLDDMSQERITSSVTRRLG
ncbi:magnesium chelatase subunit D family protein [Dyadobacter crusticola]|uniref:magnesium chelatase subunit D family protein n=1 Tax=Dyadobacter crusticola TaxID=292407 RepID=UPI0004E14B7C|nr:magnesium chelatase subunit D family protein [Dyadobacter crusticola]